MLLYGTCKTLLVRAVAHVTTLRVHLHQGLWRRLGILKIHSRRINLTIAGAGTSDCDKTMATISSQLELHRLNTGRQVRVVAPTGW